MSRSVVSYRLEGARLIHGWRTGHALSLALLVALGCAPSPPPASPRGAHESAASHSDPFVHVQGQRFVLDGQPFTMMGCNYWSAAADSRTEAGRARVARELDRLAAMGVRVLRIMALSEGPDSEPWRVRPSLQPSPGQFTEDGLAGLDWLMQELTRRDMRGVFTLNNFWFWSGGMPQYLSWVRGVSIPYPNPEGGGDWTRFQNFSAEFFSDTAARSLFENALRSVVSRYADSPAVFAWELANEPRGRNNAAAFRRWIDETARFIKTLDPQHLITTGNEGDTDSPEANGLDVSLDHASPAIDFVSFHLWPENWGWTRPGQVDTYFTDVAARAQRYIDDQLNKATQLGKPALLLETGLPRDAGAFEPGSAVSFRDRYFELVFEAALEKMQNGVGLGGVFPWAWSGEGVPDRPGAVAQQGPYTGDPPHERQGWYSIYASDSSTVALITRYAARMASAAP